MLVQRSYTALVGTTQIHDVVVVGKERRIAGSEDESGTTVLKAAATGEARLE